MAKGVTCNLDCAGTSVDKKNPNNREFCGGNWAMNVYYNEDLDTKEHCGDPIIVYTQPVITITKPATKAFISTIFPTDSQGSKVTTSGTASVIIGTKVVYATVTVTTTGTKPGTRTIVPTGLKGTVSVIIGVTKEVVTSYQFVTVKTPASEPGTTTVLPKDANGSVLPTGTATVVINTLKADPTPENTDTPEETDLPRATFVTTGPVPGTSEMTKSGTVIVVVTSAKPPDNVVTEPTRPVQTDSPTPVPQIGPDDTICVIPTINDDIRSLLRGYPSLQLPLGDQKAPAVSCHDKESKWKVGYHIKLWVPEDSPCRQEYTDSAPEIKSACANACTEQRKACVAKFAAKKWCSGRKCIDTPDLKRACEMQETLCKDANKEDSDGIKALAKKVCNKYGVFPPPKPKPEVDDDGYEKHRLRRVMRFKRAAEEGKGEEVKMKRETDEEVKAKRETDEEVKVKREENDDEVKVKREETDEEVKVKREETDEEVKMKRDGADN
ncbi:hypothetical protein H072_4640 [Dactylellina haptotyla CBS 200.50]|uniref:Uncharacterized protein n=1 Tax=Dactylellina haptotyla (strain CBS 200.50) TaxID=1284197 RepID=S8BPS1_DACHA|nr:hypothetical protein H072_4640 [Dactylellina haptotyla CBS 200.50]